MKSTFFFLKLRKTGARLKKFGKYLSFIMLRTLLFLLFSFLYNHKFVWEYIREVARNTVKAIMEINLCHTCINYTRNNIMRLMHGGLLHREIMDRERRCASCNSFVWCGILNIALMLYDVQRSLSHIIFRVPLFAIKAFFVIWRSFYLTFKKVWIKS